MQQEVVTDIRDEDVQIIVLIEVPCRKPHPRADSLYSHSAANRCEANLRFVAVIPICLQHIAVVREPKVQVAIIIMVKEHRRESLRRRIADAVSQSIAQ